MKSPRVSLLGIVALLSCGGDAVSPPRDVGGVALTPASATIGVGTSTPFEAVVTSPTGDTLSAGGASWSTSDATIARVSDAGVVTAVAIGTARIAVTVNGRSATSNVTVVPTAVASVQLSPLELQLQEGGQGTVTARVLDAQGKPLSGRAVQWRSINVAVATVSSSGVVTGIGAGSTSIVATSEGRSASMAVSVAAVAVASVTIAPTSATISDGASRQFTAEARDGNGNVLPGRTVTWSTTTPSVISVSASGLVVGVSPGTGQVTASSGGRSATATVVVQSSAPPIVVGRVVVTPRTGTVLYQGSTNRSLQLTAQAQYRDSKGDWVPMPNALIVWVSSKPLVAAVSQSGLVTGISEGKVTITATSGAQFGTADITVARR